MSINNKPATPLPWTSLAYGQGNSGADIRVEGQKGEATQTHIGEICGTPDARYIAHAANAYPLLVLCLKMLLTGDDEPMAMRRERAADLLRELGEA